MFFIINYFLRDCYLFQDSPKVKFYLGDDECEQEEREYFF